MRKLFIFLVAFVIAAGASCSTVNDAISERSLNNLEQQTEPSDFAIREMFIESGLGEGDGLLKDLNELPKDRVVAVVQEIRTDGIKEGDLNFGKDYADEKLRIKAAYYLAKVGVDAEANESYLLKFARSDVTELRWSALDQLSFKDEYLPLIFEEAPRADGWFAEGLVRLFASKLESSPESFLRSLANQPLKNRQAVFKLILMMEKQKPGTIDSLREKVLPLTKNRELRSFAGEFLSYVKAP